jgi:hypothetical protein
MLNAIHSVRWKPVDVAAWCRRAYGRKIFYESEGGTLATTLKGEDRPTELHLNMDISGRMLVQVFCNEIQVVDELVAHSEFDTFINLSKFRGEPTLEIELHLIPATYGEVKIHHEVNFIGAQDLANANLLGLRTS